MSQYSPIHVYTKYIQLDFFQLGLRDSLRQTVPYFTRFNMESERVNTTVVGPAAGGRYPLYPFMVCQDRVDEVEETIYPDPKRNHRLVVSDWTTLLPPVRIHLVMSTSSTRLGRSLARPLP